VIFSDIAFNVLSKTYYGFLIYRIGKRLPMMSEGIIRSLIRASFKAGFIGNGDIWMGTIVRRNLTSYTYDNTTADNIIASSSVWLLFRVQGSQGQTEFTYTGGRSSKYSLHRIPLSKKIKSKELTMLSNTISAEVSSSFPSSLRLFDGFQASHTLC
jgi:hypothetical protein